MKVFFKINQFLLCYFILNLAFVNHAFSQEIHNPVKMINSKKSFIYGIDNRRADFFNDYGTIYGGYAGIGMSEKKMRLKFGFNISEKIKSNNLVRNIKSENRFFFLSIGEEIDLITYRSFVFSTYVNIGIGFNQRKQTINSMFYAKNNELILPLEPGVLFGFKINKWITLRTGGGWRFILPDGNQFNSYFVKLGALVDIPIAIKEIIE